MKYHVSTAHGIDNHQIQEWNNSRLFGTGQGSGASPAIWLAMSEVLIQALKALEDGTSFTSHCGTVQHNRVIDAFVDDSTVWVNQNLCDKFYVPSNLQKSLQQVAQMWEKFLSLSGGTLNLKSAFITLCNGSGSLESQK